jgi:L-amino acid N-acyltransferase YncA
VTAIRAAMTADAARCADIYCPFVAESWVSFELEPPNDNEMAKRIANYGETHGWLVFEIDRQVAGYAYGSPHRTREAYRTSCDVALYVDPAFARQGIGRALYSALLPLLSERGCRAAFAGSALPNDGSVGLHEAMGFTTRRSAGN